MKRLREESNANPKSTRQFNSSSRGDSCGPSHPPTSNVGGGVAVSGTQKQTMSDAWSYLKQVKDTLRDQTEKYNHFLHVMKDLNSQRIAISGVMQVKELFNGHLSLILGFNMFLPTGEEITFADEDFNFPSDDDQDALKNMYNHEFAFCEKVKERLQTDDHYQALLRCLHIYSTETISRTEFQSLVLELSIVYPVST